MPPKAASGPDPDPKYSEFWVELVKKNDHADVGGGSNRHDSNFDEVTINHPWSETGVEHIETSQGESSGKKAAAYSTGDVERRFQKFLEAIKRKT
jgi:hypothetical protein